MSYEYEKNGSKIYDKSFAIIRKESDLSDFENGEEKVVVRMIHASGMTNITNQVYFSKNMVNIARIALQNGANILCDTNMVKYGITNSRLPANNKIICRLNECVEVLWSWFVGFEDDESGWKWSIDSQQNVIDDDDD